MTTTVRHPLGYSIYHLIHLSFKGGLDFERGADFIQTKFVSLNKSPDQKQIYPHITCATDTQNIRFVFNAVKNIILHQALDASGF